MRMRTTLDLNRLSRLLLNDLHIHAKTILIVAATIVVFFALLPFHVTGSSGAYFLILYVGGFIVSSFSFRELHDRSKAHFFLMLPCSNLERFLNKWILTSVGFALGLLLVYYLFSWLSVVVNLLFFQRHVFPLDITQSDLWIGIGKYIILQAVVFLGAIVFKRYALIKTALVLGCFILVLSVVSLLLAWSFCPNCALDAGGYMWHLTLNSNYFIFWIILAPICWVVTYFRLKKYELT